MKEKLGLLIFIAIASVLVDRSVQEKDGILQKIDDISGIIRSPNYPGNHPLKFSCYHEIHETVEYRYIEFEFETFDIKTKRWNDKVEFKILDTKFFNRQLHGQRVIFELPVSIEFISESSSSSIGFTGTYRLRKDVNILEAKTESTGLMQSPDFPKKLPTFFFRTERIPMQDRYEAIEIRFETFNIPTNCDLMYVRFGDMSYCGQSLQSQYMLFKLPLSFRIGIGYLDENVNPGLGFKATYKLVEKYSLLQTTSPLTGVIQTPNFPNKYPYHFRWSHTFPIIGNYNHISMTFQRFQMKCDDDSFLSNGNRDCGNFLEKKTVYLKLPRTVRVTSRSKEQDIGFRAVYTYIRQPTLVHPVNESFGILKPPEYPKALPIRTFFVNTIQATDTYKAVEFNFKYFEMKHSISCYGNDRLGFGEDRYCGVRLHNRKMIRSLPVTISVQIEGNHSKGFNATYTLLKQNPYGKHVNSIIIKN